MVRHVRTFGSLVCAAALASPFAPAFGAGPAPKPEVTAPGYPAWTGLTPDHCVKGRELTPSDLRQRYVIMVLVEAAKFKEQLPVALGFMGHNKVTNQSGESIAWEHAEMIYDTICVCSVVGGNAKKLVAEYDAYAKENAKTMPHTLVPPIVYTDVTFAGAPDAGGKYPFVYLIGPEDDKVLYSAEASAAKSKVAGEISKAKSESKLGLWKPYFGYCAEPKHCTQLKKALLTGKPLEGPLSQAKKGLKAKDAEKAKECQIVYDAINQARSDLLLRIQLEVSSAPHRAAWDVETLLRQFPKEKKRVAAVRERIKKSPDLGKIVTVYKQVMTWYDPDFTPKSEGEAKKIVQQLEGIKKQITPLKESQNILVSNAACVIETDVDELISTIPSRVPSK